MAKPYSYDLRRKVIDAIELDGMKRCEASEHFRISRNTINLCVAARNTNRSGSQSCRFLAQIICN